MVKFTITVSDGYIRERADVENISKMIENGQGFAKSMVDIMAFSLIEHDIKTKDNVEYEIDSNDFTDSKKLKIFNDALSIVASLVQIKDVKEVKEVAK
jgi:hypothetical protein